MGQLGRVSAGKLLRKQKLLMSSKRFLGKEPAQRLHNTTFCKKRVAKVLGGTGLLPWNVIDLEGFPIISADLVVHPANLLSNLSWTYRYNIGNMFPLGEVDLFTQLQRRLNILAQREQVPFAASSCCVMRFLLV